MKKKALSLVLASAMVASLVGCGSSAETETHSAAETTTTEPGITALTVIGCHHVCCNRFPESSWTAITDKFGCCIDHTVCVFQKFCFIYIYLRIKYILECTVIRI